MTFKFEVGVVQGQKSRSQVSNAQTKRQVETLYVLPVAEAQTSEPEVNLLIATWKPQSNGASSSSFFIIYLFSKMEKYSWMKQENTEQGEPGSYERLRKPLHAYSLSNLIQWKRRNTHTKNIKNYLKKTLHWEHRRKLEKSTFWMDRRNLGSELKSTTFSGRGIQWLVHSPLMGGLLHLVQRWGDWAGPQPAQAPINGCVPTSYYSMWHYNCFWSLIG